MKIVTIILLACFASVIVFGQDGGKVAHIIKGKVVNANSNKPVSYTNIGLEGTYYGTASDADGNFELKIPQEMVDKVIYFSALGFKNRQFPVENLFEKEFNVVKLKAQSYDVDEVDIAAQNMVLIRILRMVSENIKYNYGSGPFNMHCSYNVERKLNNKVEASRIASVLIYDENGYSKVSPKDAYVSRKYKITKESKENDYSFSSGLTTLDDMLSMDWVRSSSCVLNPALLNNYKLKLIEQPTINGKEYWVISFSQEKPTLEATGSFYATVFEGEITVNKEDYSVLKFTFTSEESKQNRQGRGLAVGELNNKFYSDVKIKCIVEYKDLLVNRIVVDKQYYYNGETVSMFSTLKVDRAHTNNLTKLETRQYFAVN